MSDKTQPTSEQSNSQTGLPQYRANFLWPHEEDSIEEAGYEFANGKTEEYVKQWWEILKERAAQIPVGDKKDLDKASFDRMKWTLEALRDQCTPPNIMERQAQREWTGKIWCDYVLHLCNDGLQGSGACAGEARIDKRKPKQETGGVSIRERAETREL